MDYDNLKNNCDIYNQNKENKQNKIDPIMKFDSVPLEEFDKICNKRYDNDINTIEI